MKQETSQIPITPIILDEDIYPGKGIDHRRVGIFAENLRNGIKFDPIEVEPCPDKSDWYRLLDGAHRWSACKSTGKDSVEVLIKELNGADPLLYAAKKAIGRARQNVDVYIADLRAATQQDKDIKIFSMNRLGIP